LFLILRRSSSSKKALLFSFITTALVHSFLSGFVTEMLGLPKEGASYQSIIKVYLQDRMTCKIGWPFHLCGVSQDGLS
jgi:methionine salvage enolase-phosphatase E1